MSFAVPAETYDRFMGRYSRRVAPAFARFAGIEAGMRVLDVGCGPGALTGVLAGLVGAPQVAAADPSPGFAAACAARVPGADVRETRAEALPWADATFDAALAQLVVGFMADPEAGVREMARVVAPGATVAACTWDSAGAMRMLDLFWAAALALDPAAPAEAGRVRFGARDELHELWSGAGLADVEVQPLDVLAGYEDFDDFWEPLTGGVGPAGEWCASLAPDAQVALREECRRRLGDPQGPFELPARSWAARGRRPA
ncbi:class I SAM-dependent methyltransferase [Baekduia soli]|uniref:Class I SAM-dependent methyltransferase n=1 Tax=Baekduia soli TaxID=496014 RepID=A0A5B8U0F3_9ACTN|nr:class I SAM-dependent methyltransferase [Baekduia soli]QEC46476.1 class I SAM-dependent methyltransferase [Baekduia soli]